LADDKRGRSFVRRKRPSAGGEERKKEPPDPGEEEKRRLDAASATRPGGPKEERERIVVPRQERGRTTTPLDLELREVRRGATTRGVYLRVVPSRQRFRRVGAGHIEATRVGSRPAGRFERLVQAAKGTILGSPLATAQSIHERLTKIKALAILGSDPLSSSAYATEEALIILALAGTQGLDYLLPIGIVVAALLILVMLSYRQTIRAYPGGGGAYAVSHDNLGRYPGLVAAGALMVDYTLLVSVSVSAGVAAITSAVPELLDYRVPMAVVFIVLFTVGNLRGVRESGTIFAAPTYFFILAMGGTVTIGFVRVLIGDAPGTFTEAAPPVEEVAATQGLTLWLVLRAFSSGASALTGVETIANGTPTFKAPESRNAGITLVVMAAVAVYMFLGITFAVSRFGLVPETDQTLVSSLGRTVLGENVLYYLFQAATAMILFLAANSSFNAFPLLGALLARDRYLPRQFSFRGDRLAFSNGILLLAVIAIVLLVIYDAQVTKLIPLYAVGVFIAFTLSQTGMVKRWWTRREPGWRGSMAMNLVGLVATFAVALIIGVTKFAQGAWISLLMVALLIVLFSLIRRHYDWYEQQVKLSAEELRAWVPAAPKPLAEAGKGEHVIIPVDDVNRITLAATDMAREISGNITAVHLADNREQAEVFRDRWEDAVPDVLLLIIESPYRAFAGPMIAYIDSLEQAGADRSITVILPGFKAHHWWESLLHNQAVRRLRPFLDEHELVRIVDFDYDVRAPVPA